jgi:hypothetical protein
MLGSTLLPAPLATADDGQSDVRFWRNADIPMHSVDVRSGHHDIVPQYLLFDPFGLLDLILAARYWSVGRVVILCLEACDRAAWCGHLMWF